MNPTSAEQYVLKKKSQNLRTSKMPKHLYGKESSGHRAVGIVLESEVEHEAIFRLEHELYPTLARVQYYIILLMLFSGCRGNSDC